jgi:NAD(P)-dependent dehydrogenase (short-subunit alcohol dehydrogenase family)
LPATTYVRAPVESKEQYVHMGQYTGKNVVITGGSSGFGLETAKLFCELGARVLVTGRTQATLDSALKELAPDSVAVRSDSSSLGDIDDLVERVRSDFGSVDALFVNAGITRFVPFEATPEEIYDELFEINAKGTYFTVQRFVPLLRPGSGVVLTTSVTNSLGIPMISAYSASKAAIRSMARSFARELLPNQIRVNAVSPGPVDTGILDRSMPPEAVAQAKAELIEQIPMRRLGESSEIAKAVVHLAFEATYSTGFELVVDGGGSQL